MDSATKSVDSERNQGPKIRQLANLRRNRLDSSDSFNNAGSRSHLKNIQETEDVTSLQDESDDGMNADYRPFNTANLNRQSAFTTSRDASPMRREDDVLLTNIMRLEDLINSASKEENPPSNFQRMLREETKADQFERKLKKKEEEKHSVRSISATRRLIAKVKPRLGSFDADEPSNKKALKEAEKEIICNSVEQMYAKIKKK